jgi:hypothetical protein
MPAKAGGPEPWTPDSLSMPAFAGMTQTNGFPCHFRGVLDAPRQPKVIRHDAPCSHFR